MTTLDDLLDRDVAAHRTRAAGRQAATALGAGLWGIGWLLAKTLWLLMLVVGGFFYGVGWTGRRAVWPGLVWCGRAVRLGWEEGRPSRGEAG